MESIYTIFFRPVFCKLYCCSVVADLILTHCSHESRRNAWAKDEIFDNFTRNKGKVKENLDHITLLTIVALVIITIHNQVFSTLNIDFNEVEHPCIDWICENVVPSNSLDWLFG